MRMFLFAGVVTDEPLPDLVQTMEILQKAVLLHIVIQLVDTQWTTNRNRVNHEDAICRNFTTRVKHRDGAFVLAILPGQAFWSAAKFFKVEGVHFLPTLYPTSGHENEEGIDLEKITCRDNATSCRETFKLSELGVDPNKVYELDVRMQCHLTSHTHFHDVCDGFCEDLTINISFMKSTLSPTTRTADTPKPKLVDAPREMGIFIVIGGVFLSILVIIIYYKRRQNISYTKERKRIQSSDTESVLWTSSEGGEYHHRNVLMIAVSEGISQEVDEILRLLRANSSLEVTFHEETMKEVALNENDWIDIQFKRADYAIVVLSESLFVESAIASFTEKLLRRLESETIIGGVSYTAVCFDGPNTWNLLNRMKTAHRLLTFPTAFTFTDITTRPLDNRNKHTMATLVESIKQREDISYK